jgi:hypothetical protein
VCLQKIGEQTRTQKRKPPLSGVALALAGILFAWLVFYGAGEGLILFTSRLEQASWQGK